MNIHLFVRAEPRFLIATNVVSLLLVELLLVAVSRIPMLLSPLALVLLGLAVLAGFAADMGIWFWTGVRSIELSDEELTLYRGPRLSRQTVPRSSIARLRVRHVAGGGMVRLRTRSGLSLRLSEVAFPREEFRRFLAAIRTWER